MIKKVKSTAKFAIIAVGIAAIAMTGCKKKDINNPPPQPSYSIEKQWLVDGTVPFNLMGNTHYAKVLVDISVTKSGSVIIALNEDYLGSLLGLSPGDYFYTSTTPTIVIKPIDGTSGTIYYTETDEQGNPKEVSFGYSDLTENTITFTEMSGIDGKMTAKAATEKIELKFVQGN